MASDMLGDTKAYSGFAVDDIDKARILHRNPRVEDIRDHGQMWLHLAGGRDTLVYPQPGATPAT